ncbi:MAG: hypothetical protein HKN85_04200 [Gammaproteobacteria bacterium]|nr:hypothetical protein [Gammaproteobacteria bacterium]
MNYPADVFFDIEILLNTAQPSSILLLGDLPADFLNDYLEQKALLNQDCTVTRISSREFNAIDQINQRFDLGIAIDLFEHLDKSSGAQILGKLRDLLTKQFCICLPISSTDDQRDWQLTDLFGYALKRVAGYQHNGVEYGLFKYNINDYKKTPDWLNSDNWANPQMWGKYWW